MSDDIVERLQVMADNVDDLPVAEIEQVLRDAAHTIQSLRNETDRWAKLGLKGADAAS